MVVRAMNRRYMRARYTIPERSTDMVRKNGRISIPMSGVGQWRYISQA
jgi:hypothetical protein